MMNDLKIDVSKVEEWQTLKDVHELDKLFARAQSTIVNGQSVLLTRNKESFDTLTTLNELEQYKRSVYRYL